MLSLAGSLSWVGNGVPDYSFAQGVRSIEEVSVETQCESVLDVSYVVQFEAPPCTMTRCYAPSTFSVDCVVQHISIFCVHFSNFGECEGTVLYEMMGIA